MKMTKSMLPAGTDDKVADELIKVYEKYDNGQPKYQKTELQGNPGVFQVTETQANKQLRMEVMKAVLKPASESYMAKQRISRGSQDPVDLAKASVSTSSNITPYDLRSPSLHLVPWLSPIRESLPRITRPNPGTIAHWKAIIANSTSYTRGGAPSIAWINEGQRAPLIGLTALNASATYASMGVDGNVTYEAESASTGFEDALAAAHFFALETLMVKEEDALIGGNYSLTLGTATKPVGSISGSGSFSGGPYYCAVIGLTYEGYRDYVLSNGLNAITGLPNVPVSGTVGVNQQAVITTLDSKTMTVNRGCGQASTISTTTATPSSSVSATFTNPTPKTGEIAWAWYIGTSSATNALYLQGVTTVPSYTFTSAPLTTTQLLSTLTVGDFSANNGTLGGGTNQVTGFDGLLTQALNNTTLSPQNAYVNQMAGATLTTGGQGNVVEIDTMLVSMWNNYKVTVDVIYVNAQELTNITKRVLNGSSAPLLRVMGDSDGFDVTGYGVISFYHNPYIPGGRKIPIMVHPTLPPGTILGYAKNLPPYFKTNSTPNVAEVLTRRDYYSKEWADVTREYQFGVYSEEVLAVYAPFCLGVITGIGNG
jgi:hypothetical protein